MLQTSEQGTRTQSRIASNSRRKKEHTRLSAATADEDFEYLGRYKTRTEDGKDGYNRRNLVQDVANCNIGV